MQLFCDFLSFQGFFENSRHSQRVNKLLDSKELHDASSANPDYHSGISECSTKYSVWQKE